MQPLVASEPQPLCAHGKFLSRAGKKFFLKAIRVRGAEQHTDFSGKLELLSQLRQWKAAGTTAIIVNLSELSGDYAEALVDLAGEIGLYVLLEIKLGPARLLERGARKGVRQQLATLTRGLGDRAAVGGYLLDPAIGADWLRLHGLRRIQRRVEQLIDQLHGYRPDRLVALHHQPSTLALASLKEDWLYCSVPAKTPQELVTITAKLHNLAEARPLAVEFDQSLDAVQDEMVAAAFAAGAAAVAAPPFQPPRRPASLDLVSLRPEQMLPFKTLNGTCPPALVSYPMVSVVICAYNAERTMRPCLESLCELDYPNLEVIIVDDGSRDRTAEIATDFPQFRLIRQPNRGLSVARNVGMQAARGEIVAYTDSDCVVDPHWLTLMVKTMVAGGFDGCGGPNYAPHEEGRIEACVAASPGAPCHVLTSEDRAEHLAGCNMVFRKELLQQLGGFDPQFSAAGDDVDICWRALDAGFVLGYSAAAFVWHFRRNTVKAYYGQQRGYGKAEAMLYAKYPERFNALGQVRWQGRIPGLARTLPGGSRPLVHWGSGTRGFFQTVYEQPQGLLKFLPQTLEWVLLWSVVLMLLLCAGRSPLPALGLIGLGPVWALYYAWQAPLEKAHRSLAARLLIAFLAYTGPMRRTITRYKTRLSYAWSAQSQVDHQPRQRPHLSFIRRALSLSYWNEGAVTRDQLIERLLKRFANLNVPAIVDSGWNDYDLELRPDPWTRVELKSADEEHEAGKRKTLALARLRLSVAGHWLLGVSTGAALLALATLGLRLPAMLIAGLALVVAAFLLSELREAGQLAYRSVEECADELGLFPLGRELPKPRVAGRSTAAPEARLDS